MSAIRKTDRRTEHHWCFPVLRRLLQLLLLLVRMMRLWRVWASLVAVATAVYIGRLSASLSACWYQPHTPAGAYACIAGKSHFSNHARASEAGVCRGSDTPTIYVEGILICISP